LINEVRFDVPEHVLLAVLTGQSAAQLKKEGNLSDLDTAKDRDPAKLLVADRFLAKANAPSNFVVADFFNAFVTVDPDETGGSFAGAIVPGKIELDIGGHVDRRQLNVVDRDSEALSVCRKLKSTRQTFGESARILRTAQCKSAQFDRCPVR